MRDRRTLALLLVLLAGACASEGGSDGAAAQNEAGSPEDRIITADPPPNAPMPEVSADPGLAGMSPYRRRAYDRGFRDCRAGRYDPDPHPESYRIGCAAAQDRGESDPPQG